MNPIPIGYFAKIVVKRPDWLMVPNVEDICSVSECMSAGPDDWFSLWQHNGMCLFDDAATIAAIAAQQNPVQEFDLFAYGLIPIRFAAEGETVITAADLPSLAGTPPAVLPCSADFELLGYDCVQTEWHRTVVGFGCSPLSCNGLAQEIAVNRHCLIDGLDDALAAARRFAREQP